MAAEDADLEIGLHWDPAQNGFDVNLRFENIASGTDEWKHPMIPCHRPRPARAARPRRSGLRGRPDRDGAPATGRRRLLRPRRDRDRRQELEPAFAPARQRPTPVRRDPVGVVARSRFRVPLATRPNVLLSRYLSSPDWRSIPAPRHDLSPHRGGRAGEHRGLPSERTIAGQGQRRRGARAGTSGAR